MSSEIRGKMGTAEWGMLLFLSLVWGGSFFFVGIAVTALPAFTIVAARLGLATLALWLLLKIMAARLPSDRKLLGFFLILAVFGNVIPFSLLVWGQQYIPSGLASILNASTPFFVILVAHVFTVDEKITWGKFSGVIIGLFGVSVMIGLDILAQGLNADIWAQLACVGAGLSYSIAGVLGRKVKAFGLSPLVAATGQMAAGSLLLLPIASVVDEPWTLPQPPLSVILALIGLALLSTVLAYLLYFRLLARAGATNTSLVTFLIPVNAILLGTLFLDETLHAQDFLGMALIGLGLAVLDGRPIAWVKTQLTRRLKPDSGKISLQSCGAND